jgi:hypothetical protein
LPAGATLTGRLRQRVTPSPVFVASSGGEVTSEDRSEVATPRWLVRAIVVVAVAAWLVSAWVSLWPWHDESLQHLLASPVLLAYPLVGAVVLRQRRHPIGWLLVGLGALLMFIGLLAPLLEGPPRRGLSPLLALVLAFPAYPIFAMLLPLLGYRFPEGRRLPGRNWRWCERALVVGVVAVTVGMLLSPTFRFGRAITWTVVNPLSNEVTEVIRPLLEPVATATLAVGVIGAVASIVTRFRRSAGVERLQLRWLTVSILAVGISFPIVAGGVALLLGRDAAAPVAALYSILVLIVPAVGVGVAVTRYHLYDIDRVVSRSVGYAIVTATLLLLYAAVVLSAQMSLGPREVPDIVVAAATLAVAAMFRPLRRRVQAQVDRRFDRRAYDGRRVAERFAGELRDEVDPDAVARSLRATTGEALRPSSATVWVLPRAGDTGDRNAAVTLDRTMGPGRPEDHVASGGPRR